MDMKKGLKLVIIRKYLVILRSALPYHVRQEHREVYLKKYFHDGNDVSISVMLFSIILSQSVKFYLCSKLRVVNCVHRAPTIVGSWEAQHM